MSYPIHISNQSITIYGPKGAVTIRDGDKRFLRVRAALLQNDFELALQLIDRKAHAEKVINDSPFTISNGIVRYKGMILNDVISKKLLAVIADGAMNLLPIQKYVEKIILNPSNQSATELYDFLGYRELPITPEGMVLAYRGVLDNYYSKTGNTSTVVLKGKVNSAGQIFNGVGETIKVLRSCVDDNRKNTCSQGVHVGSYDYAKSWAGSTGRVLLVEFNPADAVSVPEDCECQKLRVCEYRVLADVTGRPEIKTPIVDSDYGEVSIESIIETMLGLGYDPSNDTDARVIAQTVETYRPDVSFLDALNHVLGHGNKDSKIAAKIETYVRNQGGGTAEQIQSSLKIKGLTCKRICEIAKKIPTVHVCEGDISDSKRYLRNLPSAK
jgi:hypothetical protein